MVAVSMNAGWGNEGGQAIQQLQGREAERRAAGQIGPRQNVEHLVGASTDEVKAVEGERGPGAITDQALEAGSVVGLDVDAAIETEPTAVIPGQHILGFVGLQDTLAAKVAEHAAADGVLEALQELGGESGGFVEAEAVGGGVGVPVSLDSLEESVHHAKVKVEPSGPKAGARSAAIWLPARPSSDAKLSSMKWGLRLEPKRCRKLTVPIDADSGAVGQASLRVA